MLGLKERELRPEPVLEDDRAELEAYLSDRFGDKFSYTIPEVAKVFGKSIPWARRQCDSGLLRTIWHGGQRTISRPALIEAYLRGF